MESVRCWTICSGYYTWWPDILERERLENEKMENESLENEK